MVNNCTSYPQNLKVIPVPYGSLDQHSSQLSQPLLGIPIVTTTKLTNVETKVQNFYHSDSRKDNPPPSRRLRLPMKFNIPNADGVFVVQKIVMDYHIEQLALNLPRQLLEVAFAHKPKYITVIDGNSWLFHIRLRTKHNNRKTTILGKGFKEYIIANNMRRGNVITMSFNPNYPDQLHCAVVAEA
ncbi:hypothetical protein PIB30_029810 [Stylosanthes scabra]|uniref:TF-B3 domain-containing protein n=1 Tax=Stylosanthes scabra TaxID=79078 RepID=A0ABU6UA57_9FABA|nr:hypothetical protein [Stylosanthes scabra]